MSGSCTTAQSGVAVFPSIAGHTSRAKIGWPVCPAAYQSNHVVLRQCIYREFLPTKPTAPAIISDPIEPLSCRAVTSRIPKSRPAITVCALSIMATSSPVFLPPSPLKLGYALRIAFLICNLILSEHRAEPSSIFYEPPALQFSAMETPFEFTERFPLVAVRTFHRGIF